MDHLRAIRERLGATQSALAAGIGVTQANISHYECGRQQIPPDVARRLIAFAKGEGVELSFDDIYSPSPELAAPSEPSELAGERVG